MNDRRAIGLIVFLSVFILLPFTANYFTSDDFNLIHAVSKGGPFAIWSLPPTLFFRPLVSASMWLNFYLGGWDRWTYYLPNFVLHSANSALVFVIAKRLLDGSRLSTPSAAALSALAALLFLSSPSHAEALFFMSCRTDLLAAFFGLASVAVFLKAVRQSSFNLAVGSVFLLALGCLCKESVYAIFLFFLAVAFLGRRESSGSKVAWTTAISSTVVVLAAVFVRSMLVTAALPYGGGSSRIIQLAKAAARFGVMLVKPSLPIDPGIALGRSRPSLDLVDLGLLVVVVIGTAMTAWFLVRPTAEKQSRPPLMVPLLAFLATGLPVCFLSMPITTPEDGRLMYLPSAFTAILMAFLFAPILNTSAVRIAAALFVGCAACFVFLNGVLYRSAANVCDRSISWLRHNNPRKDPTVFLVPDSIGGRCIWRNGFDDAIKSFSPEWRTQPRIVAVYAGNPTFARSRMSELDLRAIGLSIQSQPGVSSPSDIAHASLIVVSPNGEITRSDDLHILLSPTQ